MPTIPEQVPSLVQVLSPLTPSTHLHILPSGPPIAHLLTSTTLSSFPTKIGDAGIADVPADFPITWVTCVFSYLLRNVRPGRCMQWLQCLKVTGLVLSNTEAQFVVSFFWCTYAFKPCPLCLIQQQLKWSWVYFASEHLFILCAPLSIWSTGLSCTQQQIYRDPRNWQVSSYSFIHLHFQIYWLQSVLSTFPANNIHKHLFHTKMTNTSLVNIDESQNIILFEKNILWKLEVAPFCLFASKIFMGKENGINWVICHQCSRAA